MKNSIIKLFVFALTLLIGIPSWAQTAKAPKEKTKAAASLLWKIEGNGLEKASYLYGTIHLMSPENFKINDQVKEAFNQSEQVVMELKMDDPALQMNMMKLAPMKDGKTVDQLLTDEQYKALDEAVKRIAGASVDMFKSWHPMLLSSFLFYDIIGKAPASYEGTFVAMAKEKEMEIFGVETVEDQISVFASMGAEQQATYLAKLLDNMEQAKADFQMMESLYIDQKIQKLYDYTSGEFPLQAKIEFLDNRNKSWIEPLNKLMAEKASFIAVGAAHLAGDSGVINLLKQAGYTVSPVKTTLK